MKPKKIKRDQSKWVKPRQFRFTDEEMRRIDWLMEQFGAHTRIEVLRRILNDEYHRQKPARSRKEPK